MSAALSPPMQRGVADPVSDPLVITAARVGCRVGLDFPGGVVHSVFRRACNIQTRAGELLTLLAPGVGHVPHGIECALKRTVSFEMLLRPGYEVLPGNATLSVPQAALNVECSSAPRWSGAVAAHSVDPASLETQAVIARVRALVRQHAPTSGFTPALLQSPAADANLTTAISRRLAQSLPLLARGSSKRDVRAATAALSQLVGLGPGLTPSGDDFIVGYMAALWSRSARDHALLDLLDALAEPLTRLSTKTLIISRQFILDAVVGQFSERLVDLMRAIARYDVHAIESTATRLLCTGHSSGADTILGLMFGFDPLAVLQPMRDECARSNERTNACRASLTAALLH